MRRLGSTPEGRGSATAETCPDVFETDEGDFLIIGQKVSDKVANYMAADHGGSIGYGEIAILLPRRVLLDAKKDIPDE